VRPLGRGRTTIDRWGCALFVVGCWNLRARNRAVPICRRAAFSISKVMSRWLVYTSAGVLLFAGVACFLAASIEWGLSMGMASPIPSETSEQAGFVLEIGVIGALNLAAGLMVLVVRRQSAWWLVVGLQAAVLVAALVEGLLTDPIGWIAFSTLPLVTLLVLVALRFVRLNLTAFKTPS
jgi:hypothetical protein